MGKKSGETKFDKTVALQVLKEMIHILKSININPWLTDGTLLGYYREGDFIGHDSDLDLGVLISDYNSNIKDLLLEDGWRLVRKLGFKDLGLELTFSKYDHNIDLFFFYKEEGKLWHAAWQGVTQNKLKYRKMIKYYYDEFDLIDSTFLGVDVKIPKDPEKYIITKYGKDWRIPIKNWDWALDPSNACPTDILIPRIKRKTSLWKR